MAKDHLTYCFHCGEALRRKLRCPDCRELFCSQICYDAHAKATHRVGVMTWLFGFGGLVVVCVALVCVMLLFSCCVMPRLLYH